MNGNSIPYPAIAFFTIAAFSLATGMYVDNFINPVLIWGGAECSAPNEYGIKGCFGYLPAGILIIFIAWSIVTVGIVYCGKRLRQATNLP